MTNFLGKAGEMEELSLMRFIWDRDSVPLPFPYEKYAAGRAWKPYDYEVCKGVYLWDSLENRFIRTANDSAVRLRFSKHNISDAEFLLSDYRAADLNSRPDFPLKLNAVLSFGGSDRLTISHSAEVADDLPLKIQSDILTKDSKLGILLNRTRQNDSGTLTISVFVENNGHRFIDAGMDALIGYSSMGYFFKDIRLKISVFNHLVTGRIDYGKIDPTAKDYVTSFNANTDIQIVEKPGNNLVGKIVLEKNDTKDLLDYYIRFNDGSKVPVSEYLPFLDNLLNMKL